MCRLFAYVHAGQPRTLRETLGPALDEYQQLARVHHHGWGAVWHRGGTLSSYVSTTPADRDPLFGALADQALDSVIVHERLASPGIDLSLDNQQPFTAGGLAFAHNGSISNADGNIVHRPDAYRADLGLVHSTTQSDSKLYAEIFFQHLARLRSREAPDGAPTVDQVHAALSSTLVLLRKDYPDASYNNLIETSGFTFATQAHADQPQASEGLRRYYEEAGWADQIACYPELRHTTLAHGGVTSVVSSSGFAASDGWTKVANNTLVVLSHRDGSLRLVPLSN
jgi:glutamine amidotransferase